MAKTRSDLEILERMWAAPAAVPETQASAAPTPTPVARGRLGGEISAAASRRMLIAWAVLYGLAIVVQPAADNPAAVPSAVENLTMTAFTLALMGALVGLTLRRRWGFSASLGAAAGLLGLAAACPATGHHVVGTWWFVQLACSAGLVGLSAVGLLRR